MEWRRWEAQAIARTLEGNPDPNRYIRSGHGPGGFVDLVAHRQDMMRFDQLGPLTRQVINESPINLDVDRMIGAFRHLLGRRELIDPDDPSTWPKPEDPAQKDRRMAEFLASQINERVPNFEPIRRRSGD